MTSLFQSVHSKRNELRKNSSSRRVNAVENQQRAALLDVPLVSLTILVPAVRHIFLIREPPVCSPDADGTLRCPGTGGPDAAIASRPAGTLGRLCAFLTSFSSGALSLTYVRLRPAREKNVRFHVAVLSVNYFLHHLTFGTCCTVQLFPVSSGAGTDSYFLIVLF